MFSTSLLYVGLPRKAFPGKQAKVDTGLTGHQCFSVAAQAGAKIRPKASPMAIFKWKTWIHTKASSLATISDAQNALFRIIARMNVEWKLETAEFAEFNLPTCGNIAVWQLCREKQPLWKSHDGLNLTCLDQFHGVRFHGTSTFQGWRKRIVVQSTVYIWSICLHLHTFTFVFSTSLLYVGLPRKAFPGKQAKVDTGLTGHQCFSVAAQAGAKIRPKASPMAIFKWKTWIHTKASSLATISDAQNALFRIIARMNVEWKLETAEFAEFNLPTCGNIAVWQLCRERQPLWKSHDGLNLTCLDQFHGVRFHGTSTFQGWRKRIVVQSTV